MVTWKSAPARSGCFWQAAEHLPALAGGLGLLQGTVESRSSLEISFNGILQQLQGKASQYCWWAGAGRTQERRVCPRAAAAIFAMPCCYSESLCTLGFESKLLLPAAKLPSYRSAHQFDFPVPEGKAWDGSWATGRPGLRQCHLHRPDLQHPATKASSQVAGGVRAWLPTPSASSPQHS